MKYFERVCAIDISPDIRVENHRIKFEVKKNILADKNSMRVDIYNLSDNERNKISNAFEGLLRLQAGYLYNTGLVEIGQGNISNVVINIKRPDIITTIYNKDGFKATRDNYISLSFSENTPLSAVIKAIAAKLNIPIKSANYDENKILKGGYSCLGNISEILDQLGAEHRFNWSIQNGQLQIIEIDKSTNKMSIFLSPSTGLIDDPEEVIVTKKLKKRTRNEYNVVSLLQPQLEAGDLIQVESKTITGTFIVNELSHSGDTRGNEWYTRMLVVKNG
jgi:hypothetical protein